MRYIYILRCKDNSLYTGITKDVEKRVFDHNNSKIGAKYTKSHRPVKLVRHKKVREKTVAAQLEYKIKKMEKQEKENLIKDDISRKKMRRSLRK